MATYYVHKFEQESGDHLVHIGGCSSMPATDDCLELGDYGNCRDAVREAEQFYDHCNGCFDCCRACHSH